MDNPPTKLLAFGLKGFYVIEPPPDWYLDWWREEHEEEHDWDEHWRIVPGFSAMGGVEPLYEFTEAKGTIWPVYDIWNFRGGGTEVVTVDPDAHLLFWKEYVWPALHINFSHRKVLQLGELPDD